MDLTNTGFDAGGWFDGILDGKDSTPAEPAADQAEGKDPVGESPPPVVESGQEPPAEEPPSETPESEQELDAEGVEGAAPEPELWAGRFENAGQLEDAFVELQTQHETFEAEAREYVGSLQAELERTQSELATLKALAELPASAPDWEAMVRQANGGDVQMHKVCVELQQAAAQMRMDPQTMLSLEWRKRVEGAQAAAQRMQGDAQQREGRVNEAIGQVRAYAEQHVPNLPPEMAGFPQMMNELLRHLPPDQVGTVGQALVDLVKGNLEAISLREQVKTSHANGVKTGREEARNYREQAKGARTQASRSKTMADTGHAPPPKETPKTSSTSDYIDELLKL